ncbi:MAG: hypothetical protein JO290_07760 [Sphingomonadaceae bacterium]|nr:hypothetical protein [Sphingomonadaceae bacterium]
MSYRDFENQLLVGLYRAWQDGRDLVPFGRVVADQGLEFERGWLVRAHDSLTSKGYVQGPANRRNEEMTIGRLTADGMLFVEDNLLDESVVVEDDQSNLVPAADRVVSLSHNQSAEIEIPLEEVIRELDTNNGLSEDPTFRQRVLGQLRAGRELIRAGEFKLALFHLTVITALNELIVRYRDGIIAGLATNLLQYLITNGFGN